MTLVSIIIPSYRQPQFLGRAIESCLEQEHAAIEVIVIDDHSQDSSVEIAYRYAQADQRVRVFEARENGGLGKARNIGLRHAMGEFVVFLDSDDYLLPGSLTSRLRAWPEALAEHGESLVAVYGDWQHVGEDVDHIEPRAPRPIMPTVSAANYTGENVFICSAPLVLRERVLAAGGFPEGLPMLEDFALWARMLADGAIFAPVRHVVATYRQRPNSMLRGEDGVVMADYVEVINQWMTKNGVSLADGGALGAWLEDRAPNSYGRMSWNVPSILGNFGNGRSAESVDLLETVEAVPRARVLDFMARPERSGLETDALEIASVELAADRSATGEKGAPAPSGDVAVVHVADDLVGYPALDAWISVALHALADAGYRPRLVADRLVRESIPAWRSALFSNQACADAHLIVTGAPDTIGLASLAPTVVFAPSDSVPGSVVTATELAEAIASAGSRR